MSLAAQFKIRRDELPLTISLAALHFLIIVSFTLARIARDGLFLAELPASYLPYTYIGVALWTALVVWVFGKTTAGFGAHKSLSHVLAGTALSLVLFSVWFARAPEVAAIAFYLWSGAYGLVLVSQFWLLANDRINSRQAKRLFGVVGAAGIFGGLVGGAVATRLGDSADVQRLLLLVALLHAGAAVIASRSGVRNDERPPGAFAEKTAAGCKMGGVLGHGYVRLLAALFLVAGITAGILDYGFKFYLQERFVDAARISSVLGVFYAAQNIMALVAQLGIAGFVISRFGPRAASISIPAGVLVGSVLMALAPVGAIGAVLITRLWDATLRVSIGRSAWEYLYYPLSDAVKRPAKRLIDVVISRSGDAGAGIAILGLNAVAAGSLKQIGVLVLAFSVVWVLVELAVTRAYRRQVSAPLRRGIRQRSRDRVAFADTKPDSDWAAELESEEEARVLYALEVLRASDFALIESYADLLLGHPSHEVQAKALAILIAGGVEVKSFAWGFGESQSPGTGEAIAEISLEETVADRVAVAAAAARPFGSDIPRLRLPELFDDPDKDVRITAFRSAGLSGDRSFVPKLIERLAVSVGRKEARDSLVIYGDKIVGVLGDYLLDTSVRTTIRVEISKVLAAICTQDAAYSLFRAGHLGIDRIVVNEVLRSLNRIRLSDPSVSLPWDTVQERLEQEITRYCRRIVQIGAVDSVRDEGVRKFLIRVLEERGSQSLERISRRLALIYPTRDVLLAHEGYLSGNTRLRAQALEYLETILQPRHKQILLPVLEAESRRAKIRNASLVLDQGSPSFYGTLMEMLESREQWLNAVGLFAVGTMKLDIHYDQVIGALESTDLVVRDTANWAKRLIEAA